MSVNLLDFRGENDLARFSAAMEYCKESPGTELIIPPGDYTLSSPLAHKTMEDVLTGRLGENPEDIMFRPDYAFTEGISFHGQRGTRLRGNGARLHIDGFMEPLSVKNSADIVIEGLSIDYIRRPFSMGIIENVAQDASAFDVHFGDEFPLYDNTPMPRYCAYDARTGRFNLSMRVEKRTRLSAQVFRFYFKRRPDTDLAGQEFYVWHTFHYRPAILIEDCENIVLRETAIHSQPGMGIVGHRCENVLLDHLRVVPAQGLHMSTNTDATHFTSCKGFLTFEKCDFEGHGDDATNVHGFYHDIEKCGSRTYRGSIAVRTHSLTLDAPDEGDILELTRWDTLTPVRAYRVLSVKKDEKAQTYTAELDGELPESADEYAMMNVTRLPFLTFRGCRARNHWARSVLIKTRGALVEECLFEGSVLQAIHIAAEGSWREGAAPRDVTVRRNLFLRCGLTGHSATGGVLAEIQSDSPAGAPIQNIVIEENVFVLPGVAHAITVKNAGNIKIRGNAFRCEGEPRVLIDCENVTEN